MRYCGVINLKPGMSMGKPIYGEHNRLLLGAGNVLDDSVIKRLKEMSLSAVCIDEPGTDHIYIDDPIDNVIYRNAKRELKEVIQAISTEAKRRSGKTLDDVVRDMLRNRYVAPITGLSSSVRQIIEEYEMRPIRTWDTLPQKISRETWFFHGVDVAILSILLGYRYGYNFEQLSYLGLGAILHDIGKAFMTDLAIKSTMDLSEKELEIYKKHPAYGVTTLEHSSRGHYVAKECLLQHHERQDGEGFPQGLIGKHRPPTKDQKYSQGEIYHYAEIVSVVDAYVSLTTGGWFKNPLSPADALQYMRKELGSALNNSIREMLEKIIQPFPTGATVCIKDNSSKKYVGYYGVVDTPNLEAPHKPTLVIFEDNARNKINTKRVNFKGESFMELQLDL